MGLVLSRPSDVAAGDAVPALELLPGADDPVYVGGPVQPEAFMVLAEFDDVDAGGGADLRQRRLHARRGRAGRARDQALPALLGLRRLGRRPARVGARGAVVDRRRRRAGRRVRRRPGRALAHRAAPQGRPVRDDGRHAVRPGAEQSAAIGGRPTVSPRGAGRGRSRSGTAPARRPGCTNQHSPVPSLVAASHIASATSSGCSSGKPASAKRARWSCWSSIGVSAMPGQIALIRIGASCGATLRTKPTTACFVSE